jgi:hypothetical protein
MIHFDGQVRPQAEAQHQLASLQRDSDIATGGLLSGLIRTIRLASSRAR